MATRQRNSSSITEDLGLPNCSICHGVMEGDISMTPCSHSFCTQCITHWLGRKSECPICKNTLVARQLIRNRELPELVKKIKDMHSVIGATVTGPTTDSAVWKKHKLYTDKLLKMKQDTISRLKNRCESCETEIQHQKGEVTRLKAEIHSIPTLREKIKQLEEGLARERQRRTELHVKLEDFTSKEASLRSSVNISKKSKDDWEKKGITYLTQIQKSADDLEHVRGENEQLTLEISKFEVVLKDEHDKFERILEDNKMLNAELATLKQANRDLCVELEKIKNQACFLLNRTNQLEMYEQCCREKDEVLQELHFDTLLNKNHTINKLQTEVQQRLDVLESLGKDTIPLRDHTLKIQAELQQTKDNLKKSYETARDAALAYDEENRKTWQKRLTTVNSQLKSQEEINELSTATKTYKNLVKENIELQNTVSQLKQSLSESQHRMTSYGDTD